MFCILNSINWLHFYQWSVICQWKAKILAFPKIYSFTGLFYQYIAKCRSKITKILALYCQVPWPIIFVKKEKKYLKIPKENYFKACWVFFKNEITCDIGNQCNKTIMVHYLDLTFCVESYCWTIESHQKELCRLQYHLGILTLFKRNYDIYNGYYSFLISVILSASKNFIYFILFSNYKSLLWVTHHQLSFSTNSVSVITINFIDTII